MCINVPKAATAATATDGDSRDNAVKVDGGHPPTVGNDDAVASITTNIPCPDEAPPPFSFRTRIRWGYSLRRAVGQGGGYHCAAQPANWAQF